VDRAAAAQVVLCHHAGSLLAARAEGAPLSDGDLDALEVFVAAVVSVSGWDTAGGDTESP